MSRFEKLKNNLIQSQNSGLLFRQQIKNYILEINRLTEQISLENCQRITLKNKISSLKDQLKQLNEENSKMAYKVEKLEIKVSEQQNRTKVYEESLRKKSIWNDQLQLKMQKVLSQIQQQNKCSENYQSVEENLINSNYSRNSEKKTKFEIRNEKVGENLRKIEVMEKNYNQLIKNIKQNKLLLETKRRTTDQLKGKLKQIQFELQQYSESYKQNYKGMQNLANIYHIKPKEADLCQLEKSKQAFDQQIKYQRQWILALQKRIKEIFEIDCQTVSHLEIAQAVLKEVKRQSIKIKFE